MKLATVLKINDEELYEIAQLYELSGDDLSVCRQLTERYNFKMIACTYGAKGSLFFNLEGSSFLRTPVVEVKDTIGAGDAFTTALVVGLLNGFQMKRCHETAVRLSAYVCTQEGAMPLFQ